MSIHRNAWCCRCSRFYRSRLVPSLSKQYSCSSSSSNPLFTAKLSTRLHPNTIVLLQGVQWGLDTVFRRLSKSSSQQPLGFTPARRWYSVFCRRLHASKAHFSGPSLGSETNLSRGLFGHSTPRVPVGTARSLGGLMVQSRVRQRTANRLTAGST